MKEDAQQNLGLQCSLSRILSGSSLSMTVFTFHVYSIKVKLGVEVSYGTRELNNSILLTYGFLDSYE